MSIQSTSFIATYRLRILYNEVHVMRKDTCEKLGFVKKTTVWRNLLLVLLFVSLIPLLIIAQYNHSCADDFSYGIYVHQTWNQTHNLFDVAKTIAKTVSEFNQIWQGTYSAIVLFTLEPAVWGEQFYFLTTYILVTFLLLGVFTFFRSWIGQTYGRKDIADIVACCVSIAFIQMVPMPVESLYWWNGASFYIIWNSLMLVQISRFFVVSQTQKCSPLQCVIMSGLGVLLAGANYITALLTIEITVLFLVYCICTRNRWKQVAIILIVTFIGFIISVTAPGNAIRQQQYETVHPLLAIINSFLYAYRWAITWTPDTLILLLALCLPFAIGMQRNAKVQNATIPLWLKLTLIICLFVSTFTPTIYSGNGIGPERAQNMRFLLWVIVCFVSEFLIVQHAAIWLRKRGQVSILENMNDWFTPRRAALLVSVFLLIAFLSGMRSYHFKKYECFTSVAATYSLLNGEAKEYDRIADQRMQALLSKEPNIVLQPFLVRPFLLYFNDITDDPNDLSNKAMAVYYGKESIATTEED